MKLISEESQHVSSLIEENKQGGKKYFIEGIFMQANTPNKNKRIYPLDMMAEEVQKYINAYVVPKRALGELGHPNGPQINLPLVSHTIVEMYQDGHNFIGKAQIIDSPNGMIVKGLMEAGWDPCVSSRGLGTLKDNGKGINEVSNYKIATAADIVHDPSCAAAVTRGIMEGCEWIYDAVADSWVKQELTENLVKELHNIGTKRLDEEQQLKAFERYMKILSSKQ